MFEKMYSVTDIQDYFEYIIQKHKTVADNPLISIYANNIENRIIFRIKTKYYLGLLTPETMKLFGSPKSQSVENMPHLEITEVVSFHANVVNNDYEHNQRLLYTLFSNKSCRQLLNISLKSFVFLKIFKKWSKL